MVSRSVRLSRSVISAFAVIYLRFTDAEDYFAARSHVLRRLAPRSIDQLKLLIFPPDLALRMPREEAKVIFDQIRDVALSIDKTLILDIMGSYRRGQETCGDLDILLTRSDNDGKTHAGSSSWRYGP